MTNQNISKESKGDYVVVVENYGKIKYLSAPFSTRKQAVKVYEVWGDTPKYTDTKPNSIYVQQIDDKFIKKLNKGE